MNFGLTLPLRCSTKKLPWMTLISLDGICQLLEEKSKKQSFYTLLMRFASKMSNSEEIYHSLFNIVVLQTRGLRFLRLFLNLFSLMGFSFHFSWLLLCAFLLYPSAFYLSSSSSYKQRYANTILFHLPFAYLYVWLMVYSVPSWFQLHW